MKIKKFDELNEGVTIQTLRENIALIIAGDWVNHEDDRPMVEDTTDEIMELINDFLPKLKYTQKQVNDAYDKGIEHGKKGINP